MARDESSPPELAVALRHPRQPSTWFGARPVLEMGLCRKHRDDRSVAVALSGAGAAFLRQMESEEP